MYVYASAMTDLKFFNKLVTTLVFLLHLLNIV